MSQFSFVKFLVAALFIGLACSDAVAQETAYARGAKLVKSREYERAMAAFQEGATSGDAACMDYLGYLYLQGLGSKRNPQLAFDYFRKGADLNNDQACRNLGNMYFDGQDIPCDAAEARRWWQKATELGRDPRPAFSLAQLLTVGDGVETDVELATQYWKLADKLASENSSYSLVSDDVCVALAALNLKSPLDPAVKEKLQGLASRGHVTAQGTLKFIALEESGTKTFVKDVPFVHQAHNFCGLCSSTMILRSKGIATSQFDLAKKRSNHQWGHGTNWKELVSVAAQSGQKWKIVAFPNTLAGFARSKEALLALLKSGSPVIIDILEDESSNSAHSIVIIGYDAKTGDFLARNSALSFPGLQVFSEDRLKTIWRSRGFIPNNKTLQRPLIATGG